jgi:WD repeat-containing protein 48
MAVSRKDFGVTVLLQKPVDAHRGGIAGLALDGNRLYTGGRDGTVRLWNVSDSKAPRHERAYYGHADWITDLAVDAEAGFVISSSHDSSVRLCRSDDGHELACLRRHTDYVKAFGYSRHDRHVVSGGLDGQLLLWDLARPDADPTAFRGRTDSVYSIAAAADTGSVLFATGGADHAVRLWDARTASKIATMRGHSDIVRALALSGDGTVAVSTSADRSVRVWDLGTRRCLRTIRAHSDSVWAVAATPDLSCVLAGGRDGRVVQVNAATGAAYLLFVERAPVLRLLLTPSGTGVWAATESPVVQLWVRTTLFLASLLHHLC